MVAPLALIGSAVISPLVILIVGAFLFIIGPGFLTLLLGKGTIAIIAVIILLMLLRRR